MHSIATDKSSVPCLADQLEIDIRRRGLFAGDRYLTAAEAAARYGVSRMTANRAMNVLAERELLTRHRSRGTFVGPAMRAKPSEMAQCVHYLSFVDEAPTLQLPVGQILSGLRSELSETNFETHFVRLRDAVWHVRNEVEKASADPAFVGFILALGTREVQRYLADVALPVVVYGSVYPGIKLPFVEIDQKQCGRLMAKEAIDAGHRRLIVVNRELWRRGDTLMLDGVTELVHAAGLGAGAVTIRNISPGPDAVAAEIDHLLDELREPTALLCRSHFYARAALDAAVRRHVAVPEDLLIICSDTEEEGLPLPYPCVRCQLNMRARFAVIGRMLSQLSEGRVLDPDRLMLALEMEQPSAHPFRRKEVPA